jgi:hypothetical protein
VRRRKLQLPLLLFCFVRPLGLLQVQLII